MTFSELIKGIKTSAIIGEANVNITGVEIDSRKVKEGNLFVAIKGTQVDGHQYIPKAIELLERPLSVAPSLLGSKRLLNALSLFPFTP